MIRFDKLKLRRFEDTSTSLEALQLVFYLGPDSEYGTGLGFKNLGWATSETTIAQLSGENKSPLSQNGVIH